MNYMKVATLSRIAIRSLSNVGSSSESSLVKSATKGKFVLVEGKFVKVQGEDLPTLTEEITHTGQFFDDDDWRRNRYIDRSKIVNRNWAVEMVNDVPPIEVESRIAYCEGKDGPDGPAALGHPRVYINLDKGKAQSCMYCGLRYIRKPHH
ncbi:NADH dehydrogenase [ubiquinone] iron-sulfur protein 6, mitochondrial-like [Styela clava]|uniref:NADH dehydrogenase [ubiquinone] iron-sulfur protein 6, mitochondrial-like n=1 Tax=Styela clava TaxID=7725 RepID=UPI00193940C0|nr:NADH dehydrogenase [ubiquinone] iron-sulfur protein 6, mitochondrial-like [Styela clava]